MVNRKAVFVSILTVTVTIIALSTNSAMADTTIPQWIKNTAKFWVNGDVGDADFIKAIQYLVQQGIIQVNIPVKEISATNGSPSDNDRVTSIVVTFQNLVNYPKNIPNKLTVNSFQRIFEFGQITNGMSNSGTPTNPKSNPEFRLDDLPSKDKAQFYQFLNVGVSSAQNSQSNSNMPQFDVLINLYTGDGTLLHTLEYDKCSVVNYWVYTDSNKMDYRMSSDDQAEDREASVYLCQGYHLVFPSTTTPQ